MNEDRYDGERGTTTAKAVGVQRLVRLLKNWNAEEKRWLNTAKDERYTEAFRDRAIAYANVYARCAEQLKSIADFEHQSKKVNLTVSQPNVKSCGGGE